MKQAGMFYDWSEAFYNFHLVTGGIELESELVGVHFNNYDDLPMEYGENSSEWL